MDNHWNINCAAHTVWTAQLNNVGHCRPVVAMTQACRASLVIKEAAHRSRKILGLRRDRGQRASRWAVLYYDASGNKTLTGVTNFGPGKYLYFDQAIKHFSDFVQRRAIRGFCFDDGWNSFPKPTF